MKLKRTFLLAVSLAVVAAAQELVPRHEIGLTLGGLFSGEHGGSSTRLDLGSGIALQANYGYRLLGSRNVALFGEVHLLASPQRNVASNDSTLTRDVASLFITPGIRVKFFPSRRIAPYAAIGGGWADYEQSTLTLGGASNHAPRTVNHGAFDYGGGVDFKLWRFVGLRSEIRDFYTGSPSYNTPQIRGGQHNVVAGAGLVLKL
jgi:opacity protein-like surface antigen